MLKTSYSRLLPALAGIIFAISSASAVTLDFSTASDLEDNFWGPTNRTLVTWQSGGYIDKALGSNNASTLVYNTNATGGSGGNAGTSANAPLNKYDNFSMSVDVSMSAFTAGNSIAFYTKLNDSASLGDLILFRFNNGSTIADFRVFSDVSATSSNGIGSGSEVNAQNIAGSGNFSTDTYYTFRVDVEDVGDDVKYTGSVWSTAASPTQIGNTVTYTFADGKTGLGQVGLRFSSANGTGTLNVDNFTVVVPEPAHWAAIFGGLLAAVVIFRRQRARAS